jgi:hypothetical protein
MSARPRSENRFTPAPRWPYSPTAPTPAIVIADAARLSWRP